MQYNGFQIYFGIIVLDIKEREFKTTPQQWKIVVDYFQEYPALLKSKFNHFDGDNREISQLWEELVNALNAVGVGARSVAKWKMVIICYNRLLFFYSNKSVKFTNVTSY